MKGNTSRNSIYNEQEGIYNLSHFKIDFQKTVKNRTFATLEKLEFNWNRNDDGTYIREYYAYEFYRANGVLAPHTNLTSFNIAGLHEGVFMMYEPVDEVFIDKCVEAKDRGGDLYKCGWTNNGAGFFSDCTYGIEDEDNCEFYNYDLKTNKKKSDHSTLKNLLAVMNSNKVTKEQIEQVIDMDNFLKFEAVSYFYQWMGYI